MTDSVTYNGDVTQFTEDDEFRAIEGPRGTVDVYDEKYALFRRVDKGDKLEKFGDGYTVVRGDDEVEAGLGDAGTDPKKKSPSKADQKAEAEQAKATK